MKDLIWPSINNNVFSKFSGSPNRKQQKDHVEIQIQNPNPKFVVKHASLFGLRGTDPDQHADPKHSK
jgi:hypothetical protein